MTNGYETTDFKLVAYVVDVSNDSKVFCMILET